jgi:hypothetical protein
LESEVGRQLLPGKGHSASGIMRGALDYRAEETGFTADEAASIHALLSVSMQVRVDHAAVPAQ